MIPGLIFLILLLSIVLIKSTEMVIVGLRRIGRESHTGIFTLSAVILALGTSMPEFFVGVTSALEGTPNLSLGVVLGSNIANIAFIGGISALIIGKVRVHSDYLKKDVWIAFFAGVLPIFLASDRYLSRVDALILISVYLAYATGFFKQKFLKIADKQKEEKSFVYRFMKKFQDIESIKRKELARLFIGLALLLASSDAMVKLSVVLATYANVPLFLVGLFVVAIGTSLPELTFSLKSLTDHEPSMFFGNILGSTIVNSTLIVGITALIKPIRIVSLNEYFVAVIAFVLIFTTFFLFIRTKQRLDRWEAALLLYFYAIFFIAEIL